jgi:DNA invertase Pin-like site-specific DNA recombinase
MQIGYIRVSSESDRQTTDLQRDALLAAGVDSRHLFEDHASGAKDDRPGLAKALAFVQPTTCSSSGSSIGSADRCRICYPL